jgi:hypothetical protein
MPYILCAVWLGQQEKENIKQALLAAGYSGSDFLITDPSRSGSLGKFWNKRNTS